MLLRLQPNSNRGRSVAADGAQSLAGVGLQLVLDRLVPISALEVIIFSVDCDAPLSRLEAPKLHGTAAGGGRALPSGTPPPAGA